MVMIKNHERQKGGRRAVVILLEITQFAHHGLKTRKAVQFGLIVTSWKFDVLKMTSMSFDVCVCVLMTRKLQ